MKPRSRAPSGGRPPRAPRATRPGPRAGDQGSGLGGEQVEGRHAVAELLSAGRRRVRDVWMMQGTDDAPILDEIAALAERRRVPLKPVSRQRLEAEARTEAPQGVLAHADPLPEADFDDLCTKAATGVKPFVLALDGVTDPRNAGALLRSAEAAGATGAVFPRHRAARITPAATKAAAGAIEWLPLALMPGIPAALSRAKDLGCWVVGLAPDGKQSLFDLELATEPVVVVIGAEGPGISRLARQRCDVVVHIPMSGTLASLNAAAAGTLALFEVARRRGAGAAGRAGRASSER